MKQRKTERQAANPMGVIGAVISVKRIAFGAAKKVIKLPFALLSRSTPQPRCDVDHLVYVGHH